MHKRSRAHGVAHPPTPPPWARPRAGGVHGGKPDFAGRATIRTTPGGHGNLGTSSVDAGDKVIVTSAIGHWDTSLKPIPTPASLQNIVADVGGVIGVVAVLMEEDNVSDAGAEAGHAALNGAVEAAIDQIVSGLSLTNQEVTDNDIAALTSGISSVVSDAIQNQQNFFENLWSFLNPDDKIGHKVWFFKHDDLADGGVTEFKHRWKNEGDWEIFGHITATPLCPADALNNLFAGQMRAKSVGDGAAREAIEVERRDGDEQKGLVFDKAAMRRFRDGAFQKLGGLGQLWRLAERNTASVVTQLISVPGARGPAMELMRYLPKAVAAPDERLDDGMLDQAEKLFETLERNTRNRRLAIDASGTREVIPLLRGKTVGEAMAYLHEVRPSRHPRDEGDKPFGG